MKYLKTVEDIISYVEREIEICDYYKNEEPENPWSTIGYAGASNILFELLQYIKGRRENNIKDYNLMLELKNGKNI